MNETESKGTEAAARINIIWITYSVIYPAKEMCCLKKIVKGDIQISILSGKKKQQQKKTHSSYTHLPL